MRRLAAAMGALIVAALVLSTTAKAAGLERVDCNQKRLTVLFWPTGHPEIPSVNFPEFLLPHLEVYKPGPSYPDSSFRAFVGSGAGQWARSCEEVAGGKAPTGIANKKSVTETSALQCALPKKGLLDRVDTTGKSVLRVFAGSALYVKVIITAFGGLATFDASVCRADPAPS